MRPTHFAALLLVVLVIGLGASAATAQPTIDSLQMSAFQRFKADTIYHVRFEPRDSTVSIYYGWVPLITCHWTTPSRDDIADFGSAWKERRKMGWQSVVNRKVWSGRSAVSDTVVEVVARVTMVNPDLIKRVAPRRFEIELSGGLVLRIMTIEGAKESWPFKEKMRAFADNWMPFMHRPNLDVIVSDQDAQTLYYALEPGAPVVWVPPATK
jgi:hypothetical protein